MLSGHEQGAKHKVCMQMMKDLLGGGGGGWHWHASNAQLAVQSVLELPLSSRDSGNSGNSVSMSRVQSTE